MLERQMQEEIWAQFYLPYPNMELETMEYQNDWLSVGVTSAQGWRVHQEDAHICQLDFDDNNALFAVFDGHNGPEVARYASEKLPHYIKHNRQYEKKDYGKGE